MADEPWTTEYNVNDLGLLLGHIGSISGVRRKRKKNPIGFAPPASPPRKPRGKRRPGTFPEVPRFDVPPETAELGGK